MWKEVENADKGRAGPSGTADLVFVDMVEWKYGLEPTEWKLFDDRGSVQEKPGSKTRTASTAVRHNEAGCEHLSETGF